jgi:competence protein ComEA
LTSPIDINHADQAELQKLPGIGPKLSQRILDERAKGPFKSIDELRRVPGIGPKTLEKVRPFVCLAS